MNEVTQDQSEFNVIFVHSAIDDYPLTPEEFRVYSHIARRAGTGEAWPSVKSVSKKCRIHEDTARRCLHNLLAYGLLAVTERGNEGRSNLYRITKASVWKSAKEVEALQRAQASEGKLKRAAKRAAKEEEKQGGVNEGRGSEKRDPSETKGGGGGETEGAYPSETKGDEVYPLKAIPLKVLQEREAAAPPALEDTQEAFEESNLPYPTPADAGAADAAKVTTFDPVQVQPQLPRTPGGEATDKAKVSGGAAAGRGEAERFLRRKLSHRFVDMMLEEIQPLGVNRRADWFALPLSRLEELFTEATQTHDKHKVKVPTRFRDLLDEECRRINTPKAPAAAAGKYDRSAWSD